MTAPDELETTLLEWAKGPYQLSVAECRVVMAQIAELEATLRNIRDIHQPEWVSEAAKAAGKEPWVCMFCGTADGSWPCDTRDEVDAALDATRASSAMSPAPVGLEGHTDPKEAP